MFGIELWLVLIVLIAGVFNSYANHGSRFLPISISILASFTLYAIYFKQAGGFGIAVMAVLAIIIWLANQVKEKLPR